MKKYKTQTKPKLKEDSLIPSEQSRSEDIDNVQFLFLLIEYQYFCHMLAMLMTSQTWSKQQTMTMFLWSSNTDFSQTDWKTDGSICFMLRQVGPLFAVPSK